MGHGQIDLIDVRANGPIGQALYALFEQRTCEREVISVEGDAGAACFLRDLREDPLRAEFPLFELGESDT